MNLLLQVSLYKGSVLAEVAVNLGAGATEDDVSTFKVGGAAAKHADRSACATIWKMC